jgi:hypothetical protein
MVLNVFPDHTCRYLVSSGASKISILPKLAISQLFFYFGVLLEYDAGTNALHHPYHFGDTLSGWKRQKDMDMVFCNLKGIDFKVVMYCNLLKDLFHSNSDISPKDPFSVLRGPHQVIFCIIDCMARSLQFHAKSISYVSLTSAEEIFIAVYKTGYSSSESS